MTRSLPQFAGRHVAGSARHVARSLTGAVLIAVWWPVSWLGVRPFSDYYFFPLWLGYILAVDGLLALRTGTSPIARGGLRVVWMFLASIPLWWIFEGFNEIVGNWNYETPARYSRVEYFLLASLAFSTVVPAVLITAELVRSFRLNLASRLPAIQPAIPVLVSVHLAGWLMLVATLLWPDYAFPFVWMSVIFLLDPIVTVLGGRSLATFIRAGDWSPVINLGLGALICGWFWEMWNYFSLPKWTYDVPGVGWLNVFEMPLLGYTGYIPFGLEVYVFYAFFDRLIQSRDASAAIVSSRHPIDSASGTPL